jgi:hypothetical protein
MTQEALRMALEALITASGHLNNEAFVKVMMARDAVVEALAQEQEPVAWMYQEYRDDDQFGWRDEILFTPPPNDPIYFRNITPVYTHPPQRTWVGLTDEQIAEIENEYIVDYRIPAGSAWNFAKDIEAKLKELNT